MVAHKITHFCVHQNQTYKRVHIRDTGRTHSRKFYLKRLLIVIRSQPTKFRSFVRSVFFFFPFLSSHNHKCVCFFIFLFRLWLFVQRTMYVLRSHLISYEFQTIEWNVYLTFNHNRCIRMVPMIFGDKKKKSASFVRWIRFDSSLKARFYAVFSFTLWDSPFTMMLWMLIKQHRSQLIAPMGTCLNGRKRDKFDVSKKKII